MTSHSAKCAPAGVTSLSGRQRLASHKLPPSGRRRIHAADITDRKLHQRMRLHLRGDHSTAHEFTRMVLRTGGFIESNARCSETVRAPQ
jgi:hypothetical protein